MTNKSRRESFEQGSDWANETQNRITPIPAWNFHKILVGKDGALIRAFGPRTEPLADDVVATVKAAL